MENTKDQKIRDQHGKFTYHPIIEAERKEREKNKEYFFKEIMGEYFPALKNMSFQTEWALQRPSTVNGKDPQQGKLFCNFRVLKTNKGS